MPKWQKHASVFYIYDVLNNLVPSFFQINKSDTEDEDPDGQRLLTMAGIFDCWEPPNGGEALYSYTIITVEASKNVSSIHHRQGRTTGQWFVVRQTVTMFMLCGSNILLLSIQLC